MDPNPFFQTVQQAQYQLMTQPLVPAILLFERPAPLPHPVVNTGCPYQVERTARPRVVRQRAPQPSSNPAYNHVKETVERARKRRMDAMAETTGSQTVVNNDVVNNPDSSATLNNEGERVVKVPRLAIDEEDGTDTASTSAQNASSAGSPSSSARATPFTDQLRTDSQPQQIMGFVRQHDPANCTHCVQTPAAPVGQVPQTSGTNPMPYSNFPYSYSFYNAIIPAAMVPSVAIATPTMPHPWPYYPWSTMDVQRLLPLPTDYQQSRDLLSMYRLQELMMPRGDSVMLGLDRHHMFQWAFEDVPNGLQKEEIDKNSRIMDFDNTDKEEPERCTICLCDFEPKEKIRQLYCKHVYHVDCIDKWLIINKKCPMCREEVDKVDYKPRL